MKIITSVSITFAGAGFAPDRLQQDAKKRKAEVSRRARLVRHIHTQSAF